MTIPFHTVYVCYRVSAEKRKHQVFQHCGCFDTVSSFLRYEYMTDVSVMTLEEERAVLQPLEEETAVFGVVPLLLFPM